MEALDFLLDQKLFLPLLLKYRNYRFGFSDYNEFIKHVWYPFRTRYSCKEEITDKYTMMDIKVNLPIDVSLFDIPQIRVKSCNTILDRKEE
jgi:hypothetical protein